MSETLTKTLQHGDFASVFQEIEQPEKVDWMTDGQLRLFHLSISDNEISTEDLKAYVYRIIGDYVFSRARIENFNLTGDTQAIVAQAMRVLRKNGGPDTKGTGAELGEILDYTFLEERLGAPKIMSRVELATDAKKYASACDGIHLLTSSTSGKPYHQIVFGASNIMGDIGYAIEGAFDCILRMEECKNSELRMVRDVSLEVMCDAEDIRLARDILIPSREKKAVCNTSYGVFLGYSLGLGKDYPLSEYEALAEAKIRDDIKVEIPHILQKIKDNNLGMHSFYFYVLPFNDAEDEKKSIMEAVLKGDVDL